MGGERWRKSRFFNELVDLVLLFFSSFPFTPPKTNMARENGGLEDDFPFQTGDFQVPC